MNIITKALITAIFAVAIMAGLSEIFARLEHPTYFAIIGGVISMFGIYNILNRKKLGG